MEVITGYFIFTNQMLRLTLKLMRVDPRQCRTKPRRYPGPVKTKTPTSNRTTSAHFNFTQQGIAALTAPTGSRATYHHSKVPGLQLRVTPNGVKTFSVQRWTKNSFKQIRVTLGRFPHWTVAAARDRALRLLGDIAQGQDPAAQARAARQEMTLQQLFDEFMARRAAKIKDPKQPRDNFRLYLSDWSGRKLSHITRSDVEAWHRKLGAERGRAAANAAIKLLHTLYNRAINEWCIYEGTNPAHGVKKFAAHSRDRFLHPEELPYFWAALEAEPSETMRDYFRLSILTGVRQANCLAARWDDINLERGDWRIPGEVSKNGDAQAVVLPTAAVDMLRQRVRTGEWVFPSTSETGHLVEPKRAWAALKQLAEGLYLADCLGEPRDAVIGSTARTVKALRSEVAKRKLEAGPIPCTGLRIHDLRRTFGSWQTMTGASLTVIGKSLNHKSIGTTQIYARLNLQAVRDAVEKAANAMLSYDDPRGKVRELKVG